MSNRVDSSELMKADISNFNCVIFQQSKNIITSLTDDVNFQV